MIFTTTWWTTVTAAALLVAAPVTAVLTAAGGPGPGGVATAARAGAVARTADARPPARGAPGAAGAPDDGRATQPVGAGCAGPPGPGARCWPVTGPGARGRPEVLRGFDPPAEPWAAGHRGVDLRAGPGAAVRAAAPGVVAFAGQVAGVPVMVLALEGGLRTTYEPVRAGLAVGTRVAAGRQVGVLSGSVPHCPGPCLHWGLLSGDLYLDPLSLLPSTLRRSGPSRLLPLSRGPGRELPG
ncbi:murein hydrolase activator EnvC family protein [Actinacidiphila acidipaludis]|uniref:M23 family metallopeptidase n=1 Tax=Actinacidiphila acidipaludis TaxID=2873382 RepID=A0ABS7QBU8_9ACTN|nr:M23 family metallopeptidase [Streptomyces acidipaludis]MBY8879467.1 M23 family metallopeptidase [Streptomyces acidipaludis]